VRKVPCSAKVSGLASAFSQRGDNNTVISEQTLAPNAVRFVVQGNQAMSWKANVCLGAALGLVVMSIALAMASQGFWLVVPFAGAEALFVFYCLYLTVKRLAQKEVITVSDDAVKLEWGEKHPDRQVALPRRWSQLNYNCPESLFEVGELEVAAHGRRFALGRALGRSEKRTLYERLKVWLP